MSDFTPEQKAAAWNVRGAADSFNAAVALAGDVGLSVQIAVSEKGDGHAAVQKVHAIIDALTSDPE